MPGRAGRSAPAEGRCAPADRPALPRARLRTSTRSPSRPLALYSNVELVDSLLFPVLEFDQDDAREAGRIRATPARAGLTIGAYDLLIAAQAVTRTLVLVTSNTREFRRIRDLEVEDWSRNPV